MQMAAAPFPAETVDLGVDDSRGGSVHMNCLNRRGRQR
jgi:hypothetical protein